MNRFQSSLLAVILGSAQFGNAAILTFSPTDNSTIRFGQGNQGTSQLLFAGDTSNPGDFLRSTLAFDLNNPLLTGATINSVTLTLTVREADTGSEDTSLTIALHELTNSFTNDDVTWTSRNGTDDWTTPGGDFGSSLATVSGNPFTAVTGDTLDFSSVALASAAESAIGGSFYLLAKSTTEENTNRNLFRFASTRNLSSAEGPVLTIDYTPIPEPSSVLLACLGGVALLRRRR